MMPLSPSAKARGRWLVVSLYCYCFKSNPLFKARAVWVTYVDVSITSM